MSHRIRRAKGGAALRTLAPLAAGLALALAACASDAPPEGTAGESTPPAAAEYGVSAPPPGSPLAKVEVGMDDEEVREILGPPSRLNVYHTFKAWVPFYQGGDDRRYEWLYTGEGAVTFNQNRYTGDLQVIRVEYEPGGAGS